jgi:hypothetical protein
MLSQAANASSEAAEAAISVILKFMIIPVPCPAQALR